MRGAQWGSIRLILQSCRGLRGSIRLILRSCRGLRGSGPRGWFVEERCFGLVYGAFRPQKPVDLFIANVESLFSLRLGFDLPGDFLADRPAINREFDAQVLSILPPNDSAFHPQEPTLVPKEEDDVRHLLETIPMTSDDPHPGFGKVGTHATNVQTGVGIFPFNANFAGSSTRLPTVEPRRCPFFCARK